MLILLIYNKNIFSANNKNKEIWKKKRKSSLQLKKKGKVIIVFKFFTSITKLLSFDLILDHQFFQNEN